MSSQYKARQFLSALAEPTFALGISDLVALITKEVLSKPSMHASDLTPIQNDPVLQDAITRSTAAAKMFFFVALDDVTNTVIPLKDAGSGQASQLSSTAFIYAERVMPAVARSVCINLYDYFEDFFASADRSFPTILDHCPDKSVSQIFQNFLLRFYGTDVDDLSVVIDNLFLLSKIGNEHAEQDFGGVFFMNWLSLLYYGSDAPCAYIHDWKTWKGDAKLILKLPVVATAATTNDCNLIFEGWLPSKMIVLALISLLSAGTNHFAQEGTMGPTWRAYGNAFKLLYRKTILTIHQRPEVAASVNAWGMEAAPILWRYHGMLIKRGWVTWPNT